MPAALQDGVVEGALLGEPVLSLALNRDVKMVADANLAVAPQYLLSAWFTTSAYAQKNPDLIRRFRNAIYDAGRLANKNHAATAPILAKYANLDVEIIRPCNAPPTPTSSFRPKFSPSSTSRPNTASFPTP